MQDIIDDVNQRLDRLNRLYEEARERNDYLFAKDVSHAITVTGQALSKLRQGEAYVRGDQEALEQARELSR